MNDPAGILIDIMLAPQSIGVMLILAVVAVIGANRPFFRDVWHDPARFWRLMARFATVSMAAALLWIGLLDDWLQIVTEPYRLSQAWESKREVFNPVDPTIRTISIILLALALLGIACLFARHAGGYGLQIGTMLVGALLWIPMFIMNGRVNTLILQGAETSTTLPETLGLGAFWLLRMALVLGTIIVTLIPVTMVLALVVTFLLNLFNQREPPVTQEADGFFSELGQRAQHHKDVPLKYHWKPLRRPL